MKPAHSYGRSCSVTVQNCQRTSRPPSKTQAPCISSQSNAGENLTFYLKATLPYVTQLVKTNNPRRNYTTLYVSLTPKQAQKLRNLAKRERKSQSGALRKVLDAYLKDIKAKGLPFEPYRKISPLGMRVLPRTITIEQDRKLREIAEKTGRKISELARGAVKEFV